MITVNFFKGGYQRLQRLVNMYERDGYLKSSLELDFQILHSGLKLQVCKEKVFAEASKIGPE